MPAADDTEHSPLGAVAAHEAGHAAMAAYFNFTRRGPVSLKPPVCFAGWHPRTPPPGELEGLAVPGPVLPARIRRYFEATVMVLLAGDVAEGICYWAAGPGEGIEDPPWRQAPPLPPWERAWLADHDAGEDDGRRIRGLLQQMHGPDSAVAPVAPAGPAGPCKTN